MEFTAGYTDARYTQDSRFAVTAVPPPANPPPAVVSSGDAIVGQSGEPGAPFTASVGLEYRFSVAERESFVRLDYEYQGKPKWRSSLQDPSSLQYDSSNFSLGATNFASLRAGMTFGAWQIAGFVDNLTDTHTLTNYNFSINPKTGDSRLRRDFTFRPRTIGVTFTYRK